MSNSCDLITRLLLTLYEFSFLDYFFIYISCREGGNLESRSSLRKSLNSSIVGKMKDSPVDVKIPSPGRLVYGLAPCTLEFRKNYY